MSSLRSSHMPKILGAVALIAVFATALALPPGSAEARPPAKITTYYATEQCITVVGRRWDYCDGDSMSTGQVTSFKTVQYVDCDCECLP